MRVVQYAFLLSRRAAEMEQACQRKNLVSKQRAGRVSRGVDGREPSLLCVLQWHFFPRLRPMTEAEENQLWRRHRNGLHSFLSCVTEH